MKKVAEGVYRFRFFWRGAFNAYFIETADEGIVVDASTRWDWLLMRHQLETVVKAGRRVTGVVLTHAHPDHQGCAARICRQFGVPLACHELDADAAEGKEPLVKQSAFLELVGNVAWAGRRSPVARRLREGDEVAGFRVVHLPGHTAGHMCLFRPGDEVAIVGDVVNTNDYLTGMLPLLRESPRIFSADAMENRRSIGRLRRLRPQVICPGHGPVLRDMRRLDRLAERLSC